MCVCVCAAAADRPRHRGGNGYVKVGHPPAALVYTLERASENRDPLSRHHASVSCVLVCLGDDESHGELREGL